MNTDERIAHIEGINKSLKYLRDAGHWEDFREIIMEGVIKLAERIREKRRIQFADFGKKNEEELEEGWKKEIDDIVDLSNRKDDNEFA